MYKFFYTVIFVVAGFFGVILVDAQDCDQFPQLPICRFRRPTTVPKQCSPLYLIPGRSNECGRKRGRRYLVIDPSTVIIRGETPGAIKLPGCFEIQFNVELLSSMIIQNSFLAKVSYDWLNLREFSDLPCKNQSANGCNGYGNNCYYCDICNSFRLLQGKSVERSAIGSQFTDITCPTKAGIYLLKKRFCLQDFKELDKNQNCQIDALESVEGQQYKKALENLQQSGFVSKTGRVHSRGTVIAKFTLATNGSLVQDVERLKRSQQIEANADMELASQRVASNWGVNDVEYRSVRNWFVQQRQDLYYKNEFLPKLLNENEIACLAVSFTICDQQPVNVGGQIICPPRTTTTIGAN